LSLFDLDPEPGTSGAGAEADDTPGAGPTVRLRLVVAYDGAGFRGFAAQAGQRTVGGVLAEAIATVARRPVELTCAGRTDAGVHAAAQVVHVDVPAEVDPERLVKAVNAMAGPAVVVRRAEPAPEGFDARRSALARRYRYLVLGAAQPDPLLAPLSWHVKDDLDLRAMTAAADAFIGEHDFRGFCRRVPGSESGAPIVRLVTHTRWQELAPPDGLGPGDRLLRFDVEARSFCHQMVRSMVGTLVDVGRGRLTAADVTAMLRAGDRSRGATVAPPHGLCLVGVDYPA
jgi:tRNA pseudouridine38-40 synthase